MRELLLIFQEVEGPRRGNAKRHDLVNRAAVDAHGRTHRTQERSMHTPSAEQVRQPISRSGLEQWRRFEPWLDPLKRALGPELAEIDS